MADTGTQLGNEATNNNNTFLRANLDGSFSVCKGTKTSFTRLVTFSAAGVITQDPDGTPKVLPATIATTVLTNSLGADVALNNTGTYFTGPTVAQGTSGTWFASGTVTCTDGTGAANFYVKLWDGTTVIASAAVTQSTTGFNTPISVSGFITNPAGNIRISVNDATTTTGNIRFNITGLSKDSTLTVVRIA